jgi:arsenite methyltransferase
MGCCDKTDKKQTVRESVRKGYAAIARSGGSCCGPSQSCCGSGDAAGVAKAVGYSDAELATLPEGANMGLSCGNPGAIAALKPGEVVLDLGSGGGFDVFLVAQKVGKKGRAIGVDMTPEMLSKARKNAEAWRTSRLCEKDDLSPRRKGRQGGCCVSRKRTKLDNVEFRLGEIEHLPVADASVDVVISNCVINLSPDKAQVWREIARVLKPGGRVAVSDLALLKSLPRKVMDSIEALVGCVAGAVLVDETRAMAKAAGLVEIQLTPKAAYVDSLVDCNDPLYRGIMKRLPKGKKLGDYVTSLDVAARKPVRKGKR